MIAKSVEIQQLEDGYTVTAVIDVQDKELAGLLAVLFPARQNTAAQVIASTPVPIPGKAPKKAPEKCLKNSRRDDVRDAIRNKIAKGPRVMVEMISELKKDFPETSFEAFKAIFYKMSRQGHVMLTKTGSGNKVRNVVSLPSFEKEPLVEEHVKADEPVKTEPMPVIERPPLKIEPIVSEDEPIVAKNYHGLSSERILLHFLEDNGPRQIDTILRALAPYMSESDGHDLIDQMLKSGVIESTKGGRISIMNIAGRVPDDGRR